MFFTKKNFRGDAVRKMEEAVTSGKQQWMKFANETYIKEAGWYFKTLAVQEIGKEVLKYLS